MERLMPLVIRRGAFLCYNAVMDWRDARIGAGVNPGWEPLVDELHAKVLEIDPNVVVEQVKEKFGGLRYYFDSELGYKAIEPTVREYEIRASQTCEVCGETDGTETDAFGSGWLNTLCPKHAEVRRTEGTPAWKQAADEQA